MMQPYHSATMDYGLEASQHLNQAYGLEEAGELQKALEECDLAIELHPGLAKAHNLRGMVLEQLGRSPEALKAYRQAVKLDPGFAEAKDNLADLQAELESSPNLVTIGAFSHPTEAYVPQSRLASEGIWSFVADVDMVTTNWLYSTAIGGAKLKVKENDVERALEILNAEAVRIDPAEEGLGEPAEEEKCPRCGSLNVRYERFNMRLVFLSWFICRFPLPFVKLRWECHDCGHGRRRRRRNRRLIRPGNLHRQPAV